MQSRRDRWQEDIFVACPLSDLIPDDHILKRVDKVLDLDWLHDEVAECYCQDNGRPSIDPESALRLMLAGFLDGIASERKLMNRAQTDLAFRWFMGYRLDEKLPDHSSLTRIRQRWGADKFRKILLRTVQSCIDANLVDGSTVHVDATLVRADVSWASLTTEYVEQVVEQNDDTDDGDDGQPPPSKRGRPRKQAPKKKKRSTTDPDATMSTSSKSYHLEPTFKQHTAVDDRHGVIVDIAVDTGEASEGKQLLEQIGRIEQNTGIRVTTITADAGYASAENYAASEQNNINAIIPPQRQPAKKKGAQKLPARRFKFDAYHDRVKCPNGKYLTKKGRATETNGYWYRARACDCSQCPLRKRCISDKVRVRAMVFVDGFPALLRARRKKEKGWDDTTRTLYDRHRWRVEGAHGRAKVHHTLRRAARRGLDNVAIQAYLAAAVMNLKVLAKAKAGMLSVLWRLVRPTHAPIKLHLAPTTPKLIAA
jgi:transposase